MRFLIKHSHYIARAFALFEKKSARKKKSEKASTLKIKQATQNLAKIKEPIVAEAKILRMQRAFVFICLYFSNLKLSSLGRRLREKEPYTRRTCPTPPRGREPRTTRLENRCKVEGIPAGAPSG